jgi:hypothetical protein
MNFSAAKYLTNKEKKRQIRFKKDCKSNDQMIGKEVG